MSANEKEILCIVCARGCRTMVREENGEIILADRLCRNGQHYVRQEYLDPRRVLTTTVRVGGACGGRLPIRTRGPVPKALLGDCMRIINGLSVRPPVHMGDVLLADILGTGQDVIASGERED